MSEFAIANLKNRHTPNKPSDADWRQQKFIPVTRFQLNITKAFPIAVAVGIGLIALGVGLFLGVEKSLETAVDYTNCVTENGTEANLISNFSYPDGTTRCVFNIQLEQDYEGDVQFYYGLTRFYQNYRFYLASRNDHQLIGDLNKTSDCDPLDYVNNGTNILPIVPCGFIANSMFNDTFKLYFHDSDNTTEIIRVPFTANGILTTQEQKKKFRNPPHNSTFTLCEAFAGTASPPWWQKPICELGVTDDEEDTSGAGIGLENIDLMVWMKPAALPSFRKHFRNLDRESDYFQNGLKKGNYTLIINYNYNPQSFKGKKIFIIARERWVGPHNRFLPIVCMVTGIFMILSFSGLFLCFTIKRKFAN